MPNILDSIQVSGSSYDIKDKNAPSVSAVTQQEYDNLPSSAKTSNTFFVITDATPADISQYWTSAQTQSAINAATSGKADTSAVTEDIAAAVSGKVETSAITTSITSSSTDAQVPSAKAVYDAIPTGGGGGGMTEDDELLLATALTDLNDRKIDASEVKSNYQKKGDYVTTNTLNTRLAEYETALDEQNVEEVTAYALNDLNERFGGLKIVKITESEYEALTTKDENVLYIVVADPS